MADNNNKDKLVAARFGDKEYEDLKKLAEEWGVKPSEALRRSVLLASILSKD